MPSNAKDIPKHIALVGPLPPPAGGMANQTRQLGDLLHREGIAVDVVQVNTPYRPAWIGGVRGARAAFRLTGYMKKLWRVSGNVGLMHIMANSGWSWHLFAAPAIWIAWSRRVPVVLSYHGGGAEVFFRRAWPVVRLTLKRSNIVIVPSPYLEAVFGRRRVATVVIPNVVDLALFHNARCGTGAFRYRKGYPHVVVARNLEPIYDIATALRAFSHIYVDYPEAQLTVAGAGPDRQELESLASMLRISASVRFTGSIPNKDMALLYREADLVLNPSRVDNTPIAILEALASGLPVVSTNVGGIPHLVEHGKTAMLVPPNDPREMARVALTLLDDAQMTARLVARGRAYVQQFEWNMVRDRLFGAYRMAVHKCQVEEARSQTGR